MQKVNRKRLKWLLVFSAVIFASGTSASAVVLHDESIDGDFSGTFSSPTSLLFALGPNTIAGQIGANGNGGAVGPAGNDADYFTFTVPQSQFLADISVDQYAPVFVPANEGSFIAYVAGNQFAGQGSASLDDWVIFDESTNLPQELGLRDAVAGDYSFWLQETANTLVDYRLTFTLGLLLPGDYDDDGQVAQGDLNLVLNNWGDIRAFDDNVIAFTTDNVDQEELNAVLNNWGASGSPSFEGFMVPEPTHLAVMGLLIPWLRRRAA